MLCYKYGCALNSAHVQVPVESPAYWFNHFASSELHELNAVLKLCFLTYMYFYMPEWGGGFLFSKVPKSALRSIRPFVRRVHGSPPEIERPKLESENLRPSRYDGKNA